MLYWTIEQPNWGQKIEYKDEDQFSPGKNVDLGSP